MAGSPARGRTTAGPAGSGCGVADVFAARDHGPEGKPGGSDQAGKPKSGPPAPPHEDGGHDQRGDERSQGAAAIGDGQAAAALFGGESLDHGAEPARKGGALTEPQGRAGRSESPETAGKGVGQRGRRPPRHCGSHPSAQAGAVEDPSPERIGHHVSYRKRGDNQAVLFPGEVRLAEDGRCQQGQGAAIHVADEGHQQHRHNGGPAGHSSDCIRNRQFRAR
jgi:hypothetical protein